MRNLRLWGHDSGYPHIEPARPFSTAAERSQRFLEPFLGAARLCSWTSVRSGGVIQKHGWALMRLKKSYRLPVNLGHVQQLK